MRHCEMVNPYALFERKNFRINLLCNSREYYERERRWRRFAHPRDFRFAQTIIRAKALIARKPFGTKQNRGRRA